jgi:ATP/maltotriose-dependent transcriptional regulator MalT
MNPFYQAAEVIEDTLAVARSAPSPHIEAVALRVQAQILHAQGDWDAAGSGDREGAQDALWHAAQILEECGALLWATRARQALKAGS